MATGESGVMAVLDVREAIRWQHDHAVAGNAPCTARVVLAALAVLDGGTQVGRRMLNWPGLVLEDAMPLRFAGALHHLYLSGDAPELGPVYAAEVTGQSEVDRIVTGLVERFDDRILPWFDGPPQTNEAGRSASLMLGLVWLSGRLGPKFEVLEIGASAGINTMMERYFYDLGGVEFGPKDSPMRLKPEWRGPPPPANPVEIVAIRGCDIAPVDLADPAQALRLKAYVWADAKERMARIDAAIGLAGERRPDLVAADAGEWVEEQLAQPQEAGVTRVLDHSIMWQYLPSATRVRIIAAMQQAGERATRERPLAWISLETNRQTFRHELTVRYWPGGTEPVILATAHPHGAWVEAIAFPSS